MPMFFGICLLFALPQTAFAAGSEVVGENLRWLAIILMAAQLFAPLFGGYRGSRPPAIQTHGGSMSR